MHVFDDFDHLGHHDDLFDYFLKQLRNLHDFLDGTVNGHDFVLHSVDHLKDCLNVVLHVCLVNEHLFLHDFVSVDENLLDLSVSLLGYHYFLLQVNHFDDFLTHHRHLDNLLPRDLDDFIDLHHIGHFYNQFHSLRNDD